VLCGCGHGSQVAAKATPISAVASTGTTDQINALVIGETATLTMSPTSDTAGTGVDWRVTCGGSPITGSITNGACGTLSASHTADGIGTVFTAPSAVPIGTSVTISATVTSNPSQVSSISLTILASHVAVSFSLDLVTSLEVNTTASFAAKVTNDPVGAGVIWSASCGTAACGSFNPVTTTIQTTTYTAPSVVPPGGSVTITATSLTDTTAHASITLQITPPPAPPPPPAPIAISVAPTTIYVQRTGPSRSANVTAVVLNDTANAGVDWSLSCSTTNCGTISSHSSSGATTIFQNSSTVPVGGTITLTAKSTTDPTKTATVTANVVSAAPISVAISAALPKTLNTGAQATLAAASSGAGGVDWSATCGTAGACGTFSISPAHTANNGQIVYTAPASVPTGSIVTITASATATGPANAAVTTTTVVAAPPPPVSLSFTQSPPGSLISATQAPVSVTVANDLTPGGVAWTVQCSNTAPGGCGWFAPSNTASGATTIYTAPPVTSMQSVTLVATSVANPTVTISSSVQIMPDMTLAVHFIPSLPSLLQTDATTNLIAAVTNDGTHAVVDWQVCGSGCGFFTIKPAVPAVAATATTPFVPAIPAVTATTVTAWPNGLAIPYTAPSQVPANGLVGVVALAHADSTKANSGTITITSVPGTPALNGSVQAGTQAVAGASVALYAAGVGGYGTASTRVVAPVLADKAGNFTIPAGYVCPQANSQMYLVATGGAVGQFDPNPNLALMTALGSCSSLSSSSVVVNEVTTVASAFALAPFSANDALTGNSSYFYLGTSSTNLTGLANAFAAVNNLVDISTGKARFLVPAENAALPYVEINTLADAVNTCANSAGGVEGDGSACSVLFTATDLLGTGTFAASIAPADTLQAMFNLAQHPVSNYGYHTDQDPTNSLLSLATSTSPFQPVLSTRPNDWSISLNYTSGGGLLSSSTVGSFAIDSTGNLWITDTTGHSVVEWNAIGAALSPATGFPVSGSQTAINQIAIDANNNVWVSGDGALYELNSLGSQLPWSPFGGVPGGGSDATFDKLGNLWIANANGVNEFNSVGVQISPSTGFTLSGMTDATTVGVDSTNNVWVASGSDTSLGFLAELANPGGQLIVDTQNTPLQHWPQMAADGQGNIWAVKVVPSSVCEYKPFDGLGSILNFSCSLVGGNTSTGNALDTLNPRGLAEDGAGTVWVAGQGGTGISPGVLPLAASGDFSGTLPYDSSSLAAGPLRVAIDGSGNIWVLLANNTVTEYVGAATPVVTPLALGIQTNKLAAKP
jgi:hypothetical protein